MRNLTLIIIFFINLINLLASKGVINYNLIRNITLRFFVFREDKVFYFFRNIRNKSQIYYNKSIVVISEGIDKYNNLSYEDRLLIETIIDMII